MAIQVKVNELAGIVSKIGLADLNVLKQKYFRPDGPLAKVEFGTSGHRGSSLKNSYNEPHIIAISQAIADFRVKENITGPLFIGVDQHALSEYSVKTALDVLLHNGVDVRVQTGADYDLRGYTPTPAVSFAIIEANKLGLNADGIVITPSHNPEYDGGFKYNPGNGGPADTNITKWIENRANEIMASNMQLPINKKSAKEHDFVTPYVMALKEIIDIDAIKKSGIKMGVDPLGGSSLEYYRAIKEYYGLNIEIVNENIDKTFSFMPRDWDGKARMDCSSKYAMAGLVGLKDKYDVAWGNDTDSDRHGIVVPGMGLMNPNHYLSVAVWYLLNNRPKWSPEMMIGKTVVTTSLINRIATALGRKVYDTPVGFKYFSDGLSKAYLGFGCEESAGGAFQRKDGSVMTTDKDGISLGLLSAEICAITGKNPGQIFLELTREYGMPYYERIDSSATKEMKERLKALKGDDITGLSTLAGEKIIDIRSSAPFGGSIGGIQVVTENAWFAARPSGTEDVNKLYAESFVSAQHLSQVQQEALEIVTRLTK